MNDTGHGGHPIGSPEASMSAHVARRNGERVGSQCGWCLRHTAYEVGSVWRCEVCGWQLPPPIKFDGPKEPVYVGAMIDGQLVRACSRCGRLESRHRGGYWCHDGGRFAPVFADAAVIVEAAPDER